MFKFPHRTILSLSTLALTTACSQPPEEASENQWSPPRQDVLTPREYPETINNNPEPTTDLQDAMDEVMDKEPVVAAPPGWTLVWSDEFEGEQIDSSKWQHEVNCWGGGNNEQQCYVADAKNSFVRDGALHIVALADSPQGSIGGPGGDQTIVSLPYSSARLNTKETASFTYGRFEARIRLPQGQGLWPAFWMLPTDDIYGGWAASGEIDIMEAVNTSPTLNEVHGTLHYGDSWPGNWHSGEPYSPPLFVGDTFYTYAAEWEEGEIRWYVDDVHFLTQNDWNTKGHPFPAPFDQRFHLLLNVAVGGAWPGPPDASTTFPQTMLVDFVRVYQCTVDGETGRGC